MGDCVLAAFLMRFACDDEGFPKSTFSHIAGDTAVAQAAARHYRRERALRCGAARETSWLAVCPSGDIPKSRPFDDFALGLGQGASGQAREAGGAGAGSAVPDERRSAGNDRVAEHADSAPGVDLAT